RARSGRGDRREGDPRRAPLPPRLREGDPRQEARGADRGADGQRGACRAAGGAAQPRNREGAGVAEDRRRPRFAPSGEAARRRRLLPRAARGRGHPRGEESPRQGSGEDEPGDERGWRPDHGEAERRRRLAGEADPLPALGWKGWQPADDEPERPAGAVRLRGDAVQGDREGARRLEVTVLKLTLEYDGTDFVGWQMQPNGRSVQQELERGIERLCGEPLRFSACTTSRHSVRRIARRAPPCERCAGSRSGRTGRASSSPWRRPPSSSTWCAPSSGRSWKSATAAATPVRWPRCSRVATAPWQARPRPLTA